MWALRDSNPRPPACKAWNRLISLVFVIGEMVLYFTDFQTNINNMLFIMNQ